MNERVCIANFVRIGGICVKYSIPSASTRRVIHNEEANTFI